MDVQGKKKYNVMDGLNRKVCCGRNNVRAEQATGTT